MSEAEMNAAMRSVEDEGDAEAANQAELETAAELAEFTAEPATTADPDDADAEPGDTQYTPLMKKRLVCCIREDGLDLRGYLFPSKA